MAKNKRKKKPRRIVEPGGGHEFPPGSDEGGGYSLPGLEGVSVSFGSPYNPLPDWRKVLADEPDTDELTEEERKSVNEMVGFDIEEYYRRKAKAEDAGLDAQPKAERRSSKKATKSRQERRRK